MLIGVAVVAVVMHGYNGPGAMAIVRPEKAVISLLPCVNDPH